MSVNQTSASKRFWALDLTRTMLLLGAFLAGLYLSESFGDEEPDEAPALQQPLAQVDR